MTRSLIRAAVAICCAGLVAGCGAASARGPARAPAGSRLAVWRLGPQAWTMVQQITVPVQFGSSG